MSRMRVFITGMGMVSAAGEGLESVRRAFRSGQSFFRPLSLFEVGNTTPLPSGEVDGLPNLPGLPRTHRLALAAAREAMAQTSGSPEAVVLGITTGGMPLTEELWRTGERRPELYRWHGAGTVAEALAREVGCRGPALTVATACSSSALALKVALQMLRSGRFQKVLAGGADGLCRLTYHGFALLKLIDPSGAHPLDRDRAGMTISEGAALLLLEAHEQPPGNARGEILGGGLSCDAYHPTAPHPQGQGAIQAMRSALSDANRTPQDIDYINLHGTGTRDNDASEACAVRNLFPAPPLLSSTKGTFGHTLAAAGALEAVVSVLAIEQELVPPNAGCLNPDPELGLDPVTKPTAIQIETVLSNSFGFGGNNAALVLGRATKSRPAVEVQLPPPLTVLGSACLTGAGGTQRTQERFFLGKSCAGCLPDYEVAKGLPPKLIRRLKRLPRIALALGQAAREAGGAMPGRIFFGTGWGPLSETGDFLKQLFAAPERLASPTDFVGSVHNAPAGQLALHFCARGANVAATSGDVSFEQALWMATYLARDGEGPMLLLGADEYHPELSPLFDRSVQAASLPADGGASFLLSAGQAGGSRMQTVFLSAVPEDPGVCQQLLDSVGGRQRLQKSFGAILAGIPQAERRLGQERLDRFLQRSGFTGPVIDYRPLIGEFASASACACFLALSLLDCGSVPAAVAGGRDTILAGRGVLLLSLAPGVAAVEVQPAGAAP